MSRYWLTPPELESLRKGRFDPCPFPLPEGWDALKMSWPAPWYLNPPFSQAAKFVRKALQEGGPGVIVIPTTTPTALLLEAGCELELLGDVRWIDADTGVPMPKSRAPPCIKAELPLRNGLPNVNGGKEA